jgi:hypothetical protein
MASLRRVGSSTDKRRILELAASRLWNRTRENTEKLSASISKSPFPAGAQESSIRSSKVGRHLRYAFLALMLPFCQSYAATGDPYGGWLELKGTKTGFSHTEQLQNRWWLVSPEGNAFFSKGVDHVDLSPESDSSKAPDDPTAWAKSTAEQLRGWNFNTLGAWSSPQIYAAGLAYAPMVDVAASAGRDVWLKGGVVDYFSPEFQRAADRAAQRICAPRAKEMAAPIPPWFVPLLLRARQSQPSLVEEGNGLQSLAGLLAGKLLRGQVAKLGIDQGQQFLRNASFAPLDGRDNLCEIAHLP